MQVAPQSDKLLDLIAGHRDQLNELVRTVGRGGSALRDASNNYLQMNAQADHPMLIAPEHAVAVGFANGAILITDPTTQATAPVVVGDATADSVTTTGGDVLSGGAVAAATFVHSLGDVYADAAITAGTHVTVGTTVMDGAGFGGGHFISGSTIVDSLGAAGGAAHFGGVDITSAGVATNNRDVNCNFARVWAGSFFTNVSERRLKRDITAVPTDHLAGIAAAPIFSWRYDPEQIDIPDGGADTWRVGPMVDDLPARCVGVTDAGRAPELVQMVNYLWGGVRELTARLEGQAAQIAALTARLDALELPA